MKNVVCLIGNVGKDPEVRTMENNSKSAELSLATSEKWKTKDGTIKEEVQWHTVQFWNKLADIVEKHLKKGDRIEVTGKIKYNKWEDSEGVTKYKTIIVAQSMLMLSTKKSVSGGGASTEEDDLPF